MIDFKPSFNESMQMLGKLYTNYGDSKFLLKAPLTNWSIGLSKAFGSLAYRGHIGFTTSERHIDIGLPLPVNRPQGTSTIGHSGAYSGSSYGGINPITNNQEKVGLNASIFNTGPIATGLIADVDKMSARIRSGISVGLPNLDNLDEVPVNRGKEGTGLSIFGSGRSTEMRVTYQKDKLMGHLGIRSQNGSHTSGGVFYKVGRVSDLINKLTNIDDIWIGGSSGAFSNPSELLKLSVLFRIGGSGAVQLNLFNIGFIDKNQGPKGIGHVDSGKKEKLAIYMAPGIEVFHNAVHFDEEKGMCNMFPKDKTQDVGIAKEVISLKGTNSKLEAEIKRIKTETKQKLEVVRREERDKAYQDIAKDKEEIFKKFKDKLLNPSNP